MYISEAIYYYCLFNITYYIANLILYLIDTYRIFDNRKLQPISSDLVAQTYKKCLPIALQNTLIWSIPSACVLPMLINLYNFEFLWYKTIFDIIVSVFMTDFIYYVTHWLLHTKYLYRTYHKKHHEITAPIGLSSTYMTVLDFYSNILSIYLPPIILSSDSVTVTIWIILSTLNTIFVGHGGFNPFSTFHDNHHKYFGYNYGLGVFMDRIFGTEYVAPNNEFHYVR